jgi:hypothetical protein
MKKQQRKRPTKARKPKASGSRTGRWLEKIIEMIELQANSRDGIKVEPRKRLRDKDTGRPREHDVVITITSGHHNPMIIALECRDRTRPVPVEAVESFHTKCARTGVHQGIIVSSTGFADTARVKAAAVGIRCLELNAAEQFDWCEAPGIFSRLKRLLDAKMTPFPDGEPVQPTKFYEGDLEITRERFHDMCLGMLNTLNVDHVDQSMFGKPLVQTFFDEAPKLTIIDANGKVFPLNRIQVDVYFRVEETFTPFTFHTYDDPASGGNLSQAAAARFKIGDEEVAIVIAGGPDEGKRAFISPIKDTKAGKPEEAK